MQKYVSTFLVQFHASPPAALQLSAQGGKRTAVNLHHNFLSSNRHNFIHPYNATVNIINRPYSHALLEQFLRPALCGAALHSLAMQTTTMMIMLMMSSCTDRVAARGREETTVNLHHHSDRSTTTTMASLRAASDQNDDRLALHRGHDLLHDRRLRLAREGLKKFVK